MANYDHRVDYGVSSPSSSPLKENSPSAHSLSGGGLVDSGFDTFDLLLTSPTSSNSSLAYMNGHHRLSPEPFDPLKPVQETGEPPSLLELDFFDPLAPLPEEFPSPQEASSPNDGLMYLEDEGGSPSELAVVAPAASPQLDFFSTVVDTDNFQPSPPSPHSEEENSFSEPLLLPPTIVQSRERDSGAECDSLDDDGSANLTPLAHPDLPNTTYQLPTHEDEEEDDVIEEHDIDDEENPHTSLKNKWNVNKGKMKDVELSPIEKLKKKDELPVIDKGRKKEELPVFDKGKKKDELPLNDKGKKKDELPLNDKGKKKDELPLNDKGRKKEGYVVVEKGRRKDDFAVVDKNKKKEEFTGVSQTKKKEEHVQVVTIERRNDANSKMKRSKSDAKMQLISEAEKENVQMSLSPTRDSCSPEDEPDRAPTQEILSLSPLADLKSAYLNKTPERVQNKEFIETGVSIDALKSTYLMNGHVEETEEKTDGKETISTGVDIKSLKENYSHNTQMEEDGKYKEKIETGVSIQALRASYGDLSHLEQPTTTKPFSVATERARSVGDLSRLDSSRRQQSDFPHGISVQALRASYCDLVKLDESKRKVRQVVRTGVSIKSLKTSFTSSEMNGESPGVKIDRARITRSFSQDVYPLYALLDANDGVMSRDEQSHLCRICGRPVFLMDRIKAEKSVFHKTCFRCKECNKQLMVDSYSSHEGVLFCKLHFKQLFQPKAKFDDEGPHMPRRRNEATIKENVPMELPPDVIRSSDKPDYGLEELPSLRNIKSRFELGEQDEDPERSPSQINVKRSESILTKMAKFQSENENGHYEDYSSDDDEQHDPDVIRETRKKEKLNASLQEKPEDVSFSGMTDLRTQWEKGNANPKEEEWTRETQEELTKLRQRICQTVVEGKGNVKAVYENAIQEMERSPMKEAPLDGELREIGSIAEKWERGEVLNQAEQEKLQHYHQEKEQDLSVFRESGTSAEARTLFKRIDEVVVKSGSPITLNKSPSTERSNRPTREVLYATPSAETEIVRSTNQKEDIVVDSTGLHEKFKFFENYQDGTQQQPERKRFTITPPREPQANESDDDDVPHDPNVVRSCDQTDDITVITDTAKKMLNKFRELESQAERGGMGGEEIQQPRMKPLKRITPPRDYTTYSDEHDSSPEPERDPNIVRASDKIEDVVLIEAEKTRNLRAKFENWANEDDDENIANGEEEEDEEEDHTQPSIDTTKNLKAKFEALREETERANQKPKLNKVNRFLDQTAQPEQCTVCGKRVYAMEKMEANNQRFHKYCFKCSQCSCPLRLDNYTTSEGIFYCIPHFKQMFISRGNYDEGFGREQHKEKWNRSRSTTPTPNGLNGNGDYSESTEEIYA